MGRAPAPRIFVSEGDERADPVAPDGSRDGPQDFASEREASAAPDGEEGTGRATEQGLDGELLEVAVDAARMAGALLAERVGRGVEREVRSKSTPTDLVSEADLAAEQAIRELLERRRPQDGFLGEEGEEKSWARAG